MKKKSSSSDLFKLLKSVVNGSANQKDINRIIEKSQQIALVYLYSIMHKYKKILKFDDSSLGDTAVDSIVPLFKQNQKGEFYNLMHAFKNWKPPVDSESDALFFLNRIIANRVEQQIVQLMRENDPFFAKILDSVNYLIKKEGYLKVNHFGTWLIVESDGKKISKKVINSDVFADLPNNLFFDRKKFLKNIFGYLREKTDFYPAIPIIPLVNKLKNINLIHYNNENTLDFFLQEIDIDHCINTGLRNALNKLEKTYVFKNKLNAQEAGKFEMTLTDIARDLINGGSNGTLFEYLKVHFESLEMDEYMRKYRNVLEYLVKTMKASIIEEFNANN